MYISEEANEENEFRGPNEPQMNRFFRMLVYTFKNMFKANSQ